MEPRLVTLYVCRPDTEVQSGIETLPAESVIPVKVVGQFSPAADFALDGFMPAAANGVVTDISVRVTV